MPYLYIEILKDFFIIGKRKFGAVQVIKYSFHK